MGPEVADWLQQYWDRKEAQDPSVHWALMPGPDFYRSQTCNVYALVRVTDNRALYNWECTAQLQVKRNGVWGPPVPPGILGGGVWIDKPPLWDQPEEYDFNWPDPVECPIPQDGYWIAEEYLVPMDLTGILDDPLVTDIRVLVFDFRGNWMRSENLKE